MKKTLILSFGFIAVLALGCGAKPDYQKVKISGEVMLDGQPLPLGTIQFHSKSGVASEAQVRDGRFSVTVPRGDLAVSVSTSKHATVSAQQLRYELAMQQRLARDAKGNPEMEQQALERVNALKTEWDLRKKFRAVPAKYESAQSSGLSTKVSDSDSAVKLELRSR